MRFTAHRCNTFSFHLMKELLYIVDLVIKNNGKNFKHLMSMRVSIQNFVIVCNEIKRIVINSVIK